MMREDGFATDKRLSQTVRIEVPPIRTRARHGGLHTRRTVIRRDASGRVSLGAEVSALFQSVYDGGLITRLSGDVLDANVRAVEFLGYTRDELRRMNVLDLISGADASLLETICRNLHEDRFALIQAYCAGNGGLLFPAEISVNQMRLSQQDCLCFFIRDITRRRLAERTLRTEHNAIHNSAAGIAIADLDGKLQYVNPAMLKLWGSGETEDFIGRDVRELWSSALQADEMIRAVRAGETWSGELAAPRMDGRGTYIQVGATPNRDADGQMEGMVLSFLDVSDRRRAEEATRQAERQRVMLESIGAACHHLGQPATVLLGSLAMLQKKADLLEVEYDELLEASLKAAESLGDMLHELNAISEYRTTPYLKQPGLLGAEPDRILEVSTASAPRGS